MIFKMSSKVLSKQQPAAQQKTISSKILGDWIIALNKKNNKKRVDLGTFSSRFKYFVIITLLLDMNSGPGMVDRNVLRASAIGTFNGLMCITFFNNVMSSTGVIRAANRKAAICMSILEIALCANAYMLIHMVWNYLQHGKFPQIVDNLSEVLAFKVRDFSYVLPEPIVEPNVSFVDIFTFGSLAGMASVHWYDVAVRCIGIATVMWAYYDYIMHGPQRPPIMVSNVHEFVSNEARVNCSPTWSDIPDGVKDDVFSYLPLFPRDVRVTLGKYLWSAGWAHQAEAFFKNLGDMEFVGEFFEYLDHIEELKKRLPELDNRDAVCELARFVSTFFRLPYEDFPNLIETCRAVWQVSPGLDQEELWFDPNPIIGLRQHAASIQSVRNLEYVKSFGYVGYSEPFFVSCLAYSDDNDDGSPEYTEFLVIEPLVVGLVSNSFEFDDETSPLINHGDGTYTIKATGVTISTLASNVVYSDVDKNHCCKFSKEDYATVISEGRNFDFVEFNDDEIFYDVSQVCCAWPHIPKIIDEDFINNWEGKCYTGEEHDYGDRAEFKTIYFFEVPHVPSLEEDLRMCEKFSVQPKDVFPCLHIITVIAAIFAICQFLRKVSLKMISNVAETNERISGTLATGGKWLNDAAILFVGLPRFALLAELLSKVALAASDIARRFGYSKPLEFDTMAMVPYSAPPLAITDVNVPGRKLSLWYDQSVAVNLEKIDALSHTFMLSKYAYLARFVWRGSDAVDTDIGLIGINPFMGVHSGPNYAMSPSGLVASQYQKWYGSTHWKIEVVAPDSYAGKLIMFYEPEPVVRADQLSTTTNRFKVIDISEEKIVHVRIDWASNAYALNTTPPDLIDLLNGHCVGCTNGCIYFAVMSPLTSMMVGTDEPQVDVLVSGRASEKTLFFDHFNNLSRLEAAGFPNSVDTSANFTEPPWLDPATQASPSLAPPFPVNPVTPTFQGPPIPHASTFPAPSVTGVPVQQPQPLPVAAPIPKPVSMPVSSPTASVPTPVAPPVFAPSVKPVVPSASSRPSMKPTAKPSLASRLNTRVVAVDPIFVGLNSVAASLVVSGSSVTRVIAAAPTTAQRIFFPAVSSPGDSVYMTFSSPVSVIVGSTTRSASTSVSIRLGDLSTDSSGGMKAYSFTYLAQASFTVLSFLTVLPVNLMLRLDLVDKLAGYNYTGGNATLSNVTVQGGTLQAERIDASTVLSIQSSRDYNGNGFIVLFTVDITSFSWIVNGVTYSAYQSSVFSPSTTSGTITVQPTSQRNLFGVGRMVSDTSATLAPTMAGTAPCPIYSIEIPNSLPLKSCFGGDLVNNGGVLTYSFKPATSSTWGFLRILQAHQPDVFVNGAIQFALNTSSAITIGVYDANRNIVPKSTTPYTYNVVSMQTYAQLDYRPQHSGVYLTYDIPYQSASSFNIVSLNAHLPQGADCKEILPSGMSPYVTGSGSVSTDTIAGASAPVYNLSAGARVRLPSARDCVGKVACMILFNGSIAVDGKVTTNTTYQQVRFIYASGSDFMFDVATTGAKIASIIVYPPIGTMISNTYDEWVVGSPTNEDMVVRLCAGEYPVSLRTLLKYTRPLPPVTSTTWINSFIYGTQTQTLDLLTIIMMSFAGIRGSMDYFYKANPSVGDEVNIYVARGSYNFNFTEDSVTQRGFEYIDSKYSSSLTVNHPYYSCELFHSPRSNKGQTIDPMNTCKRLWCGYSGKTNTINDSLVVQGVSVGEDFSALCFLGVPVLVKK